MKNSIKSIIRKLLPKYVRDHKILTGPMRNYRIVTSWHDYPAAILGYTEKSLIELVQSTR